MSSTPASNYVLGQSVHEYEHAPSRPSGGPVSVFGRDYQGNYAPLIGEDGKLTGALFVGVPK
jgi:Cache 3/Cache 2 fusion domain